MIQNLHFSFLIYESSFIQLRAQTGMLEITVHNCSRLIDLANTLPVVDVHYTARGNLNNNLLKE